MDSLMAETVQEKQWYLAVGERSIGPLTTDLVVRGIESGKVPLTAWICQVGASSWSALSSFAEFQDTVDRVLAAEVPANQQYRESGSVSSAPRSDEASETAQTMSADVVPNPSVAFADAEPPATDYVEESTGQRAFLPYEQPESEGRGIVGDETGAARGAASADFVTSADGGLPPAREDFPSFTEQSGQREILPGIQAREGESMLAFESKPLQAEPELAVRHAEDFGAVGFVERFSGSVAQHGAHDELGIDITFDEEAEDTVDWSERFQSYFLVGTEVALPEEEKLLKSLRETPRVAFMHDEALWNLSLCLAFGSDVVASTSAKTFFEAVGPEHASERIEWVCRTLLSKGFMPSGIPRSEGMRGIEMLRNVCPPHLAPVLERESMD